MKKSSIILGLLVIGIIILITVLSINGKAADKTGPYNGYFAPGFTLTDLNGNKVELKKTISQNKVTIVNFWATWCPPCRREIPEFVEFNKKYATKKVKILAVNLGDEPQVVSDFAKKSDMVFPVLTDTTGKIGNLYQVYAIPTTFIIDRKGKIQATIKGSTSLTDLEAKVKPLL